MFNVPKLRFGEFEGEYKEVKVGDICNCIVPGRNKPKKFDGDIPWITTPDINSKYIFNPKECLFIDRDEAKKIGSKIIPKDSVVMSCVGELGVIAITKEPIVINQQLHAFLPSKVITSEFLNYSLLTQKKYMERVATKTTLLYMNKNSCNSIPILLPKLQEQKKISTYLTSIDKKIEQLNQKSTLLESYKKGVMQKIFSQEIRFKRDDGGVFEDWVEKRLGKISTLTSSKRVYLSDYVKIGVPFYRGKEISELKLGIIPKDILYISEERYEEYKLKYGVPMVNDLLITAVGTLCNVLKITDNKPFYFKDGNLIWIKNIEENSSFLEILLHIYKRDIEKTSIGSTQRALTMVELRKIKLPFPQLEEQQKISNFLTSIDQKITQNNQALEEIRAFKKGLLQQMFV